MRTAYFTRDLNTPDGLCQSGKLVRGQVRLYWLYQPAEHREGGWSLTASLDRKPQENVVNLGCRPALPGDFWRRARRVDAHAAEECRLVFPENEPAPGILLWLAV